MDIPPSKALSRQGVAGSVLLCCLRRHLASAAAWLREIGDWCSVDLAAFCPAALPRYFLQDIPPTGVFATVKVQLVEGFKSRRAEPFVLTTNNSME
jgi:hypothetical protein